MLAKNGEQPEASYITGENEKWFSHFGNIQQFVINKKLNIKTDNSTQYLLKGDGNFCLYKSLTSKYS